MISNFDKILILSGTLWVVAVGFVIFSWVLQSRQQMIFRYLAARLDALDKKTEAILNEVCPKTNMSQPSMTFSPNNRGGADGSSRGSMPETRVTIARNEPLSKYEKVVLPDETDVDFVETDDDKVS